MSETIHPHGHYHSPEAKKKQLNRISKAIGHLQHVKTMIENDDDCAAAHIICAHLYRTCPWCTQSH